MSQQEFIRMAQLPRVAAVRITKNTLTVYTKRLIVTATDGSRWDIGAWRIMIPRNPGDEYYDGDLRYNIRVLRIGRKPPADMPHMHVWWDGKVCWGSAGTTIDAALDHAEYFAAVILIIKVLYQGNRYAPVEENRDGTPGVKHIGCRTNARKSTRLVSHNIPRTAYLKRQVKTYAEWCSRRNNNSVVPR